MGQRLVVDLVEDGEVVAAVYYHWSAYFCSTIVELANLSETILAAEKSGEDKLLAIVKYLETEKEYPDWYEEGKINKVRGGLSVVRPEEYAAAKKLFPDHEFATKNIDRNEGLITFTEKGIQECHMIMEGHATINLDTHSVNNTVSYDPDPFEFIDMSGRISVNGKICPINVFDCTCESVIKLVEFMTTELKRYEDAKQVVS